MSSSDDMIPRKTPRKDSVTRENDHISNLPDEVISLILSKLSTVEAVATSVLSKHWKYKWVVSICDIEISDLKRPVPTEESTLIHFLESLILHVGNVRSASLELKHKYDSGGLETFVSELLKRNSVEKLHIDITQKLTLPDGFFNSTSLKDVVLVKGPVFKVPSNHCFFSLTSLCLRDLIISYEVLDEDYENFVLKFPVLENLEVSCCMWHDVRYSNIHISAPALKTFTSETRSNDGIEFYNIIIHDAKLEDFTIKGCEPENFSLTGTQVVCASLQCVIDSYAGGAMEWSGSRIRSLLKDIAPTLEKFYVSVYVAQAILESKQRHPILPRFNKLRTLFVVDGIHLTNTGAVFEILHATPFLECLNIDAMFWDEYDYDVVDSVPWCITNSLEEIGLYNIMGTKGTFQLAEFLLKTATKLKVFRVGCFGDNGIPIEEAKDRISGYPVASGDVTFK